MLRFRLGTVAGIARVSRPDVVGALADMQHLSVTPHLFGSIAGLELRQWRSHLGSVFFYWRARAQDGQALKTDRPLQLSIPDYPSLPLMPTRGRLRRWRLFLSSFLRAWPFRLRSTRKFGSARSGRRLVATSSNPSTRSTSSSCQWAQPSRARSRKSKASPTANAFSAP